MWCLFVFLRADGCLRVAVAGTHISLRKAYTYEVQHAKNRDRWQTECVCNSKSVFFFFVVYYEPKCAALVLRVNVMLREVRMGSAQGKR